jgi:lysophospholipase L1-like esterase
MLVRFRQDVIDLQPKIVVILAGTNDIAGNTGPISNDDIQANLASAAELARVHNIRVIFSSVLPVNNYTPESQEFFASRPMSRILALNDWLRKYCADKNLIYLDYFSAMADEKGMLKRDLTQDGLHPNQAGYAVMAPLAEKAINKALGGSSTKSQLQDQVGDKSATRKEIQRKDCVPNTTHVESSGHKPANEMSLASVLYEHQRRRL